jgi:hypothetical protein
LAAVRSRFAAIVLAVFLSGCGGPLAGPRGFIQTPRGAVVDGWPVGAEFDCATIDSCAQLIQVATDGLTVRDSFRPNASSVTLHEYRQDEDGVIRSGGPPLIAVFRLSDGSLRAIGVKRYPGDIPPLVIDFGP